MRKHLFNLLLLLFVAANAMGQLARDNQNGKFLGNITTSYNWVEYCDPQGCDLKYSDYWNQMTLENATKWGSVHKGWGKFDWSSADKSYQYCKEHGILFKFHALIWGSQHPSWIESLSAAGTKKAIVEWFDEVKNHFPDLEIIDVVNEAIYSGGDYHSPYKQTKIIEALGGTANGYSNTQSYDWIAEAFRMARERWPNAVLIYNDYNTYQWQKTEFINIMKALKALNAPVDAAGLQSHDVNDMSGSDFKKALEDIHNQIQMPIYITEYDIAKSDDNTQLTRYKEQFPIMWEADYVAGVTLWGWVYGKTWTTDGNSGIVKDCKDRPAFTWLKEYMQTDAAKKATTPIVIGAKGGVKATLSLSAEAVTVGDEVTITVEAESKNGNITHVDMYAGDELLVNKWVAPYVWTFSPAEAGDVTIKIVAYDEDENSVEKTAKLTVCETKGAYNGKVASLPGTVEAEDFDEGCSGMAYKDSDDKNEGETYRLNTGVDVVEGNGNYALGYTANGEWTEYTVNVKCAGTYDITAHVASGSRNSGFTVQALKGGSKYAESEAIEAPKGDDWDTYTTVKSSIDLEEGEQALRFVISGPYINIDKVEFENAGCTSGVELTVNSKVAVVPSATARQITIVGAGNLLRIELIDAMGRTVARGNTAEMDIPESCSGVYTVRVTLADDVIVKKLIVR